MIEKISTSLADQLQNSAPRKVFLLSDIKTTKDESAQAIDRYGTDLVRIQAKYPMKNTVLDVLQKFIIDENNVDVTALKELDLIILQTNKMINDMTKMSVPQFLASLHLDYINALERLAENISDIKLYDTDVMLSLGAITQYEENSILLESASTNILNAIIKKLNI